MGLLDPATSDGRVIFFLPWQGNTIAGTTDSPAKVTREPTASEEDIRWVLDEVRNYLSPDIKVRRGDVLSAWSGLRPLVRNPGASSTEGLVRNHMIHVSESGLLTIAGGKWTTYRAMAEETIDQAVKTFELENRVKSGCITETLRLVGSDGWSRNMFIGLIQTVCFLLLAVLILTLSQYGLDTDVAKHLSDNYGDRAWTVCSLAEPTGESWPMHGRKLSPQYPFIDAEVRYAVRNEYAQTAIDVLARRTRLSFLNARAALDALPRIVEIMGEELGWSYRERKEQTKKAAKFLKSMGLPEAYLHHLPEPVPKNISERICRDVSWSLNAIGHIVGLASPWSWRTPKASHGVQPIKFIGRSKFEGGEIAALRAAFLNAALNGSVKTWEVLGLLKTASGLDGISKRELAYVLEEAGLKGKEDVDFEEFLEVRLSCCAFSVS